MTSGSSRVVVMRARQKKTLGRRSKKGPERVPESHKPLAEHVLPLRAPFGPLLQICFLGENSTTSGLSEKCQRKVRKRVQKARASSHRWHAMRVGGPTRRPSARPPIISDIVSTSRLDVGTGMRALTLLQVPMPLLRMTAPMPECIPGATSGESRSAHRRALDASPRHCGRRFHSACDEAPVCDGMARVMHPSPGSRHAGQGETTKRGGSSPAAWLHKG